MSNVADQVAREKAHQLRVMMISEGFRIASDDERDKIPLRVRELLARLDLLRVAPTKPRVASVGVYVGYEEHTWIVVWAEAAWLLSGGSFKKTREMVCRAVDDPELQKALRAEFELRCPQCPLRSDEEVLKEYMEAWDVGRVP